MQNFFNKISKTASEAASKAGSKASELMEIGKLKGKITTKKQYIGNTKKDIGAYCYELFEAGDIKYRQNRESFVNRSKLTARRLAGSGS